MIDAMVEMATTTVSVLTIGMALRGFWRALEAVADESARAPATTTGA
jgi:hypothetical protein